MIKLYTVTITSEHVFAHESDDPRVVERAFSEEVDAHPELCDAMEADVSAAPMASLPAGYALDSIPWGDAVKDDATIGQLIDAGAAPRYTQLLEQLRAAHARLKAKQP